MSDLRVPLGPSPREIAAIVFRHRRAALVCYAVIVLVTALYCFFWPPSYEATVRYLVKNDRLEPLLTADQQGVRTVSRPLVTEAELNSEAEIMQSRAVIERTVRDLDLASAPEHWALRLLRMPLAYGQRVYNSYHHRPDETPADHAAERLARALEVEPQRESSIILVRLRWGHPDAATAVLSKLSEEYLSQHLAVRRAPDAQQFFKAQVDRARAELSRIDGAIAGIRPGATTAQLEADRARVAEQLSEFEMEARRARARGDEDRARTAALEAQIRQVPQRLDIEDRTVVSAQALETLKLRVLELRLQRTQLLQKFDPSQRRVVEVEEQLREAERMLASEEQRSYTERTTGRNETADVLERELRTTRVEMDSLAARQQAAQQQAAALRTEVARLEADARRLRELERDRAAVEHSLDEYVRQLEEARVNDAMHFVNVAVIEPVAAGKSPVRPNRKLLMELALGLGLVVSLALPFALDLTDHRVKGERDLEAAVGVPVLAVFDRFTAAGERSATRA
jgi:uncharacterized protein involved in exopolysaccharide biosynthesis